jgi:hypothetical protein
MPFLESHKGTTYCFSALFRVMRTQFDVPGVQQFLFWFALRLLCSDVLFSETGLICPLSISLIIAFKVNSVCESLEGVSSHVVQLISYPRGSLSLDTAA